MREAEELATRLPAGWGVRRASLALARSYFDRSRGAGGFWSSAAELASRLAAAAVVVEAPWGAFFVEALEPGWRAEVHGLFWAAGVARNVEDIRVFAEAMHAAWDLRRLEVPVVGRARGVERLLRRIGFELEGRHPAGARSPAGVVQDLAVYGIIWDEGG